MARHPGDMKAVSDIVKQLDELEPNILEQIAAKATELRQAKLHAAKQAFVERVRKEAEEAGVSLSELSGLLLPPVGRRQPTRARGQGVVPVKYRDGDRSWSGRGKTPAWLVQRETEGRKREGFLVDGGGNGEGSAG